MNIAVVGGGIFGITAAVWAARERGHTVTLYEKNSDILMGASLTNQFRVHRGYHYPRSKETIKSCLSANASFIKEYGEAIFEDHSSYYCIAKNKTLSSVNECCEVWGEFGLEFSEEEINLVNKEKIDKIFRVREGLLDYKKLKTICQKNLERYGVKVVLNKEASQEDLRKHDFVIIATYSLNNAFLKDYPEKQSDYQYELCEKVVLELPPKFKGKGIVIMDGPFMCIDPYGTTGYHLMGNVVHAIHHSSIGKFPEIPPEFNSLLDKGIIKSPKITNLTKLLESADEFFPGIKNEAKHIGSKYTFRVVLPHRESDDARPTIVTKINERMVTVFSGKIPTCVDAARQILTILDGISPPLLRAH